MTWRRRYRHGRRGRFPKSVTIPNPTRVDRLVPTPQANPYFISIDPAEVEALRLVDLVGLSQEEAGLRMGISRGTVWRLVQTARRKVAEALTEGKTLVISRQDTPTTPGY